MIKVNLLPEEYKKRIAVMPDVGKVFEKHNVLLKKILAYIVAAVVLSLVMLFAYPVVLSVKLGSLNKKWKGMETRYVEVETLKKEQKGLKDTVNAMNKVSGKRIVWAKTLNIISDSLPQEIQLTGLNARVEQDKESKDKNEITSLTISGIVSAASGERAISGFVKALREDADFMGYFPLIDPPSTQTDKGGIKTFVLNCYSKEKETAKKEKTKQQQKGKEVNE